MAAMQCYFNFAEDLEDGKLMLHESLN